MGQVCAPCVGGPLNGEWWPLDRGAPVYPVLNDVSFAPIQPEPVSSKLDVVRYSRRSLTQPDGRHVEVFASEDWSLERLIQNLREIAPNGIA
jgi:hypothetical protein